MTQSPRFPRVRRLLGALRISRLAVFQLLFLLFALAVLFQVGLRPWLDARKQARESKLLARVVADFESRTASLDPAAYAPEPLPDLENSAHWALAGAAAVVDDDGFDKVLWRFAQDPDAFDPTDRALQTGLGHNAPALSLLHRMDGLRRSDFGLDYEAGAELRLPPLRQLYAAGALLGLDAVVAASDGRVKETLRSLRSLDSLTGALAREAPRQTYVSAVYQERLFDRTLRAVAQSDAFTSRDSAWSDLLDVADQPPYGDGLCQRIRRMISFDAAVNIAMGPDPDLAKQLRRSWSGRWLGMRQEIPWSGWAHHALSGIAEVSESCDEINPLRGVGVLVGTRFQVAGSVDLPPLPNRTSARWALGQMQPELYAHLEIARRGRHQRLLAIVALTLLDEARRRGVDLDAHIGAVNDLPDHVDEPWAKELASCVEIQEHDGERELVPVRRDGCAFWIDESLRWPLPRNGAD